MKIYLVDTNVVGVEHVGINRAFIECLTSSSDSRHTTLHFWGDRSHFDLIKSENASKVVEFHQLHVVPGTHRRFIAKLLVDFRETFRVLYRARKENAHVLFLSVFSPSLLLLFIARYMFSCVPTYVILHGQIEALVRTDKKSWLTYGPWVRCALFDVFRGDWPKLYVLGSAIQRRLVSFFPDEHQFRMIGYIEHPYLFTNADCANVPRGMNPIEIGFIGQGRKDKGIVEFFQLARNCSEQTANGKCEFAVVGSVKNSEVPDIVGVKILCDEDDYLSVLDYRNALKMLDAAIFIYRDNYQLTASGAVFDAIDAGLKIYSLNIPYMQDLKKYDKEGGIEIFDTLEELNERIQNEISDNTFSLHRYKYETIKDRHGCAALLAKITDMMT